MIFGSVWPLGWEGLFLYAFASLRGRWRGDMCRRAVCNVVGRLGDGVRKHVRADAAQRWLLLSVSELWAGAALSLAGFGSGRSVGARGGDNGDCPAWRWSSIAAFCARLMSAVQFYRNVLRSITHIVAVLLGRFGLDYACCLTRTPNRTACDMFRFYSAGVGSAIRAFSRRYWVILLCWFTLGLDVSLWRSRRSTTGVRLYEKKRRIEWRFFRYGVLVRYDAAGSPLGAARPQTCAKEPMWKPHCGLSGLSSFDSRRGCLLRGAHSANA